MSYPADPLAQQFHHRTLANDLLDVAPRVSLHRTLDLPLNAGAAALRATAQRPFFRAGFAADTTTANGATIKWDTVLADTAGGYNAATGVYTLPKSGVYLMSARLTMNNAAPTRSGIYVGGLDPTIYPATFIASPVAQARAFDPAQIQGFCVVGKAGDQLSVATYVGAFSARGNSGATKLWQSYWELKYMGATPGAAAGQRSSPPYAPGGWTDGEPITDLTMSRRYSEPMDAQRDSLANFGSTFGLLTLYPSGDVATAGDPVPWAVGFASPDFGEVDAQYPTIPQRTPPAEPAGSPGGLWLVSCQLTSSATNQSCEFTIPALSLFSQRVVPSAGGNGAGAAAQVVGRFDNTQVNVNAYAPTNYSAQYSYLHILQLGG